jgi:hypothetical protein
MLYADECLKNSSAYDWYNQFKNGQGAFEDKECIGRPASSKNNGWKSAVMTSDWCVVVEQITNEISVSYRSVQNILKEDLSVWHVCKMCLVTPHMQCNTFGEELNSIHLPATIFA